jgi:hypothetical protein
LTGYNNQERQCCDNKQRWRSFRFRRVSPPFKNLPKSFIRYIKITIFAFVLIIVMAIKLMAVKLGGREWI